MLLLGEELVGDEIVERYSDGCPWKQVTAQARQAAMLYLFFQKGFLLDEVMRQPADYIELMAFMEGEAREISAERNQQQQAEIERQVDKAKHGHENPGGSS